LKEGKYLWIEVTHLMISMTLNTIASLLNSNKLACTKPHLSPKPVTRLVHRAQPVTLWMLVLCPKSQINTQLDGTTLARENPVATIMNIFKIG